MTAITSAIGGFGANRIPAAVGHEILRQGRKKMGFAGHTATHDFQILCAGEVFDKLDVAYIVGLEARGLSPNARKYMESGKVNVSEWTNYSLSVRFKAAAAGVSFYPARNIMGTDTFQYSGAKIIAVPLHGDQVCGHARHLARCSGHPCSRGRHLRQLPHPGHHRFGP